MTLRNALENLSTEAKQDDLLSSLAALLAELQTKLDAGGVVALDGATLAALEAITSTVANFPADYPDAAVLASVSALLDRSQNNDPSAIPLTADTGQITSVSPLTVTPAAGNAIRLWWVSAIGDPDNSATGVVTVTLAPHGTVYRAPAVAHRQRFDGDADEALTVAVVGSGTFEATVHYEEFTP